MKKFFAILAVAALTFSLAACKKDKPADTTPDKAPAGDTKPADDGKKPEEVKPAATTDGTAAKVEAPKAEEKPAGK